MKSKSKYFSKYPHVNKKSVCQLIVRKKEAKNRDIMVSNIMKNTIFIIVKGIQVKKQ